MNKFKKNIPNIITSSRIIASISGAFLFSTSHVIGAIISYTYGAVSDAFDGYLARKFNSVSDFGKKLDAVSDKLFSLSLIIPSIILGNVFMILPLINECTISGINVYSNIKYNKTYTEKVGKIKTIYLFLTLILGILATKINILFIPFMPLLITTLEYQVKSIDSYIKQFEKLKKEEIVDKNISINNKNKEIINTNNVILIKNKEKNKVKKLVRKKDYNDRY